MIDENMLEPCPHCGEDKVVRNTNGSIECKNCGAIIFTPKSLVGSKVM